MLLKEASENKVTIEAFLENWLWHQQTSAFQAWSLRVEPAGLPAHAFPKNHLSSPED